MMSNEIRSRFLKFFEKREHKIIPSASLVPENDLSVLFNTAGMQPLVPYLLGQSHPMGTRLVNIQKCVRTQDIDEVGDNTHDTFFEMMGNWSLGDYWKEDAIKWSHEFLTNEKEGLGLDPKRLYITVFGGNADAPRDDESIEIWKKYIPENRIYILTAGEGTDKVPNWWSVGDGGPCGPDTEMFYDLTEEGLGDMTKVEYLKADKEQKIVEIWNDVFMEYEKRSGKVIGKLKQRNVDTGAGLERVLMAVQGKNNIFDTDLFSEVMKLIKGEAKNYDEKSARVIADHIRTSIFMISDGVKPSNKDRGYVLRRILRRAIFKIEKTGFSSDFIKKITETFINIYKNSYSNILQNDKIIQNIILEEENKFRKTLERGLKEFEKGEWRDIPDEELPNRGSFAGHAEKVLPGEIVFNLFQTYGFPIELTEELAKEKGLMIIKDDFNKRMLEHQKLSRTSSTRMFKSGLKN